MENIAVTTPSYTLLFVIDPADASTQGVLKGLGVDFLEVQGGYPVAANAGFKLGKERLVLIANDDVIFHYGWYDAAVNAVDSNVGVLGTNDLSPATEEGGHATQPIVRRSYIEDQGGAWGEPGNVYHEGYHHNFCETELCALAQHRRVWGFAPGSVIEHRHPDWGKGKEDDTYRQGARQNWDQDSALYEARMAQWTS